MRASRGMGAVMPSKMGKGVTKARRDNTDFTEYAEGGKVVSMPTSTLKESVLQLVLVRRCVSQDLKVLLLKMHFCNLLKQQGRNNGN